MMGNKETLALFFHSKPVYLSHTLHQTTDTNVNTK